MPSSSPVVGATIAFSDSKKLRYGILIQCPDKEEVTQVMCNPGSVQLEELMAIVTMFELCQDEAVNNFFLIAGRQFRLSMYYPSPRLECLSPLYLTMTML